MALGLNNIGRHPEHTLQSVDSNPSSDTKGSRVSQNLAPRFHCWEEAELGQLCRTLEPVPSAALLPPTSHIPTGSSKERDCMGNHKLYISVLKSAVQDPPEGGSSRTLLGVLQLHNYFHNNSKTLFALFMLIILQVHKVIANSLV